MRRARLLAVMAVVAGLTHATRIPAQAPASAAVDARRAYTAAMRGRKAEALAAAQRLASPSELREVAAQGGSGWECSPQYTVLLRFGLWDEVLALRPPGGGAPGLLAGYLYARGVALAARGRLEEARAVLRELQRLPATVPPDTRAGADTLSAVVQVAVPVVQARIASSELRSADAAALLVQAVAAEDRLRPADPPEWLFPVRQLLGAQLMSAARPAEAERVYREDLERHPDNGWSLYGLAAALRAEHRGQAAQAAERRLAAAWSSADVRLAASAFWFAGADTLSCECQREASADR